MVGVVHAAAQIPIARAGDVAGVGKLHLRLAHGPDEAERGEPFAIGAALFGNVDASVVEVEVGILVAQSSIDVHGPDGAVVVDHRRGETLTNAVVLVVDDALGYCFVARLGLCRGILTAEDELTAEQRQGEVELRGPLIVVVVLVGGHVDLRGLLTHGTDSFPVGVLLLVAHPVVVGVEVDAELSHLAVVVGIGVDGLRLFGREVIVERLLRQRIVLEDSALSGTLAFLACRTIVSHAGTHGIVVVELIVGTEAGRGSDIGVFLIDVHGLLPLVLQIGVQFSIFVVLLMGVGTSEACRDVQLTAVVGQVERLPCAHAVLLVDLDCGLTVHTEAVAGLALRDDFDNTRCRGFVAGTGKLDDLNRLDVFALHALQLVGVAHAAAVDVDEWRAATHDGDLAVAGTDEGDEVEQLLHVAGLGEHGALDLSLHALVGQLIVRPVAFHGDTLQ